MLPTHYLSLHHNNTPLISEHFNKPSQPLLSKFPVQTSTMIFQFSDTQQRTCRCIADLGHGPVQNANRSGSAQQPQRPAVCSCQQAVQNIYAPNQAMQQQGASASGSASTSTAGSYANSASYYASTLSPTSTASSNASSAWNQPTNARGPYYPR